MHLRFIRRAYSQDHDSGMRRRWITEDVGEALIIREKDQRTLDGKTQHLLIGRIGRGNLREPHHGKSRFSE